MSRYIFQTVMPLLGHTKKEKNKTFQGTLTNSPSLSHQDQQSHSENVACPPLLENENFHHVV